MSGANLPRRSHRPSEPCYAFSRCHQPALNNCWRNPMATRLMGTTVVLLVAELLFGTANLHAQSNTHEHSSAASGHGQFEIPKAMQIEHEALHSDLAKLTKAGKRTGEAAKAGKRSGPSLPEGERICVTSVGPAGGAIRRKVRLHDDRSPSTD